MHKLKALCPCCKETHPNFLFPQLTWPVLFSQARTDPWESWPRIFSLCDLFRKLLFYYVTASASTHRVTPCPVCEMGRFPGKVISPFHMFSNDGPRQSRTAWTSCLAAYFAVSPCFSTVVGLQSSFIFYRVMRRLPLRVISYIDLYLRHFKEESPTFKKLLLSHGSEIHTFIQHTISLVPSEVQSSQIKVGETRKQES